MNTATYANRKRKKPQKSSVKTVTAEEGAKSNPSKRHRERLNGELERLANLLPFPQDVVSKLDKLTVLRLSVSYLRAKSHLSVSLKSANVQHPDGNGLKKHGVDLLEGELLLQVLNGFVLVVTVGGNIFYASSTIQDYLGFHQSDVIHQRVFEFVHSDDRNEFQRQLHWALKSPLSPDAASNGLTSPQTYYNPELLPPENCTFLDRNFVCRLRCLLDNSSGFIALNFQGRLKSLHGQNEKDQDGKPIPPQLALFALASPLQSSSILEIRTKNFFFRTKHKLDFTPLACDAKGQTMLGYTEQELCYRGSGYQFIHAADMLHCAETHIRMIKMGESGMTVFRLLTKLNGWMWVRANARLIFKNGRPEFIVVSSRVITNEEGEEHLRKRSLQVPFSYTTGEAVLYDLILPNALNGPITGDTPGSDDNNQDEVLNPNSLLGCVMKQDKSIYLSVHCQNKPPPSSQEHPSAQLEDDCGGIFSSSWQKGMRSLPDSSFFKHKSQDDFAEERDAELWSFMRNLGISREDFEIFQQDETFLNVDLDGRDTLPDLTDGILCYVQESLRKRSDCAFFDSVRLGDQVPSCTPSVPQDYMHQLPKLQQVVSPNQPSIASLWQPQQAEQSHLHPQSLQFQPPAPMQQHCLHSQPNPQIVVQANQHRVHRLTQPPTPQQHQPLNGQVPTHQHCKQRQQEHSGLLFSQPVAAQHMQLCQELKHKRVNVSSHDSLSQQDLINSQKNPTLFHVDQSDVQRQSHPLHGHIYLDEPTQALPFKNQFNTVSVTCTQDLTYTPMQLQNQSTTGISPHSEVPRFSSLCSEAGGQHNVTGAPMWPVGSMQQQQQHLLVDPQPVNMDFSLHHSTTDQPHMTHFQNSSHGNHTEPGPGPKRKGAVGHSEQTKHQPPGAN